MKFISKNSNLHIIIRPGQPANNFTQTPPVPAISVRFQDGQADVKDEDLVAKMMSHPGFNQDFIAVDDHGSDPYAYLRAPAEPDHVTTEMKFGTPVGRSASPVSTQLPPEIKKMITEQATAIAQEMVKQQLPGLVAETLKAVTTSATAPATGEAKGADGTGLGEAPLVTEPRRPGRPKTKVE